MSRIAVIVPCYNDGDLLREALASVSEDEPIELVVVNDGSSDPETLRVLREISSDVRVIDRENGGLSAARMTGVDETSAPYIYPLDSDDLLIPGALKEMADTLDADDGAGFCYGDYELFGDYEGVWRSPPSFSVWAQSYANFIPVCSMVRRDALVKVGGWQLRHGVEDWDLWLAMAERGWSGAYCPRSVYRRRIHGTRMHAEARTRHRELVALLESRHPSIFNNRRELAREEGISLFKRALYPMILNVRNRGLLPYRIEQGLIRARVGIEKRRSAARVG